MKIAICYLEIDLGADAIEEADAQNRLGSTTARICAALQFPEIHNQPVRLAWLHLKVVVEKWQYPDKCRAICL